MRVGHLFYDNCMPDTEVGISQRILIYPACTNTEDSETVIPQIHSCSELFLFETMHRETRETNFNIRKGLAGQTKHRLKDDGKGGWMEPRDSEN